MTLGYYLINVSKVSLLRNNLASRSDLPLVARTGAVLLDIQTVGSPGNLQLTHTDRRHLNCTAGHGSWLQPVASHVCSWLRVHCSMARLVASV